MEDVLSWLIKQTDLKEKHHLYLFTLFICGGPCHLSSFKQDSETLFPSENSSCIHLRTKSLFYDLINIVNIHMMPL